MNGKGHTPAENLDMTPFQQMPKAPEDLVKEEASAKARAHEIVNEMSVNGVPDQDLAQYLDERHGDEKALVRTECALAIASKKPAPVETGLASMKFKKPEKLELTIS